MAEGRELHEMIETGKCWGGQVSHRSEQYPATTLPPYRTKAGTDVEQRRLLIDSTLQHRASLHPENAKKFHIPSDLVVECGTAQRKPPEVRIWRLSNQSRVGTFPPSTSTPHWPACLARH